jgi:transposase
MKEILRDMGVVLDAMYADSGRPSIAPEYLCTVSIFQGLDAIRSERALMEV